MRVNLTPTPQRVSSLTVWPSTGPGIAPDAELDREQCPECGGVGEWYGRDGLMIDLCPTCYGRGWL